MGVRRSHLGSLHSASSYHRYDHPLGGKGDGSPFRTPCPGEGRTPLGRPRRSGYAFPCPNPFGNPCACRSPGGFGGPRPGPIRSRFPNPGPDRCPPPCPSGRASPCPNHRSTPQPGKKTTPEIIRTTRLARKRLRRRIPKTWPHSETHQATVDLVNQTTNRVAP